MGVSLHKLSPAKGSVKNNKRKGRGEGSGRGGTSTRGHNGAQSRSGYSRKFGFEGGQMPLYRRIPKFGFKNINRKEYSVINLDLIQKLIDDKSIKDSLNIDKLVELGLVHKNSLVKILGDGELKSKVTIEANKCSKSALSAIEKSGGSFKEIV